MPRIEPDKTPGIFAVAGYTDLGPTLMPLGNAELVFRRADGTEFQVEFFEHKYLEIREVNSDLRMCVESYSSNILRIGVHTPLEDAP